MPRQKNALTKHHIAEKAETGTEEWLRLAKWISSVADDSDEEVEDEGFYDGDGTPESDVVSVKKTFTFEGMYDDTDPAMAFVADKEFETGEGRKIMYKQERTNGKTYVGPATLSDIKVVGGDAVEFATFNCTISWDKKPEIVDETSGGGGGSEGGTEGASTFSASGTKSLASKDKSSSK